MRHRATAAGNVPFTAAEEADADAREAAFAAGAAQRAKDAANALIAQQLAALDIKRVRPLAEGDAAYLAELNAQAIALRAQWQK